MTGTTNNQLLTGDARRWAVWEIRNRIAKRTALYKAMNSILSGDLTNDTLKTNNSKKVKGDFARALSSLRYLLYLHKLNDQRRN